MPAMLARTISLRETRAPTRSSISRASLSRKAESSRERIRLTLLIPLVSTRVYLHTLTDLVATRKGAWGIMALTALMAYLGQSGMRHLPHVGRALSIPPAMQ